MHSARADFFARLHRCAIHAESHSAPERRYSTKAEGAGGGSAYIGLVLGGHSRLPVAHAFSQ